MAAESEKEEIKTETDITVDETADKESKKDEEAGEKSIEIENISSDEIKEKEGIKEIEKKDIQDIGSENIEETKEMQDLSDDPVKTPPSTDKDTSLDTGIPALFLVAHFNNNDYISQSFNKPNYFDDCLPFVHV